MNLMNACPKKQYRSKTAKKAREMADDPIVDVDEEVFRDPGDES